MTALKHVAVVHDIERESVWPLMIERSLPRLNVPENLIRSNHVQSGAVQVYIIEAYNYEYYQGRITII